MKWTKVTNSYPPSSSAMGRAGKSETVITRDAKGNRGIGYYYYSRNIWVFHYNPYEVTDAVEWTPLSSDREFYFEMLDHSLSTLNKDRETYSDSLLHLTDIYYLESMGYIVKSFDGGTQLIKLTDSGLSFISEGGFTALSRKEQQEEFDKRLQRTNWQITTSTAKWSLFLSVIALAIALLGFLFPDFNLLTWIRETF